MYAIEPAPERESKIYLFCRGWRERTFEGLDDLCAKLDLKWIKENVAYHYSGPIKIVTTPRSGGYWNKEKLRFEYLQPEVIEWRYADYILRNDKGETLVAEHPPREWLWHQSEAISLCEIYYRFYRRWKNYRPWGDRHGRKAERVYGGYRNVKTTNERRQAFQNEDEGEPKIRPRRNHKNIINAWDDTIAHNDANWKTQSKRRHQYKLR